MKTFDEWDDEQNEKLNELPVCVHCGRPIQDDYYWDFGDGPMCEECVNEYRHFNE